MNLKIGRMLLSVSMLGVLASCGNTQNGSTFDTTKAITLHTRESGSGTRECFFEGIGYGDVKKEDNWEAGVNPTSHSSNGDIVSAMETDLYGIGYCALDGLEAHTKLKALKYEGVAASVDNVLNDTYKLKRNFNYVVRTDYPSGDKKGVAVSAFVAFMTTSEGYNVIKSKGGILNSTEVENAPTWDSIKGNYDFGTTAINLNACGSTSVEKIIQELSSKFASLTGNKVVLATGSQTGSGSAVTGVTTGDGDIGFLSRELNADEKVTLGSQTSKVMCLDAVVPIVNAENTVLSETTAAQLVSIYKGEFKVWSELASK